MSLMLWPLNCFSKLRSNNSIQGGNMNIKLSNKIKSAAASLVIAGSSLTLQSCTDEQVGTALTVVAAAAVVASAPSHPSYGNGYNDGYNDGYDNGYGSGYDNGYQDGCYINGRYYRDYDCRRYRGRYGMGIQSMQSTQSTMQKVQALSRQEKITIMSHKYGVSAQAAEKLQLALEKAQARDFSMVDDIGIARSDLQNLYENKSVSRYTQVNLGAALGISFEQAGEFIQHLQQDIQIVKTANQMM